MNIISSTEYIDKKRAELTRIKKEIVDILNANELIEYHNLSLNEMQILDDFFEKTNYEVFEKILFRIRERLCYKEDDTTWKKHHFNVSVLVITFPNYNHSWEAISYLEEKYRNKISELELDEIGLVDCNIVRAQTSKKDVFYNIPYSNPKLYMKSKYSNYSYTLEVTFAMNSVKKRCLEKNNYKQEY